MKPVHDHSKDTSVTQPDNSNRIRLKRFTGCINCRKKNKLCSSFEDIKIYCSYVDCDAFFTRTPGAFWPHFLLANICFWTKSQSGTLPFMFCSFSVCLWVLSLSSFHSWPPNHLPDTNTVKPQSKWKNPNMKSMAISCHVKASLSCYIHYTFFFSTS